MHKVYDEEVEAEADQGSLPRAAHTLSTANCLIPAGSSPAAHRNLIRARCQTCW